MTILKKVIFPIIVATVWISISEFVRNEILVKSDWVEHYQKLGLVFPSEPLNGAMWGVWSLCLSIAIFVIAEKFSLMQTTLLAWFVGFVLMWLVIWNLNVLPVTILVFAVPLSLLEVFLASFIIKKMTSK
ncbi:MAG: hypothetical protein IT222_04255 [Crocinitomix sp.]|nr:hypothetical protein [Crocinitomix sp.]